MEIPPTHAPARRAAAVAQNCINYQQGTPHQMFQVRAVEHASLEVRTAGTGGPHIQRGDGALPSATGSGREAPSNVYARLRDSQGRCGRIYQVICSVSLCFPPTPRQGTRELPTHIDRRLPAQNEGPAEARPSGDPASTGA